VFSVRYDLRPKTVDDLNITIEHARDVAALKISITNDCTAIAKIPIKQTVCPG